MGKNKKSKYVGSCGMYVFYHDGDEYRLLVHRRSKQVSESHKIAAPGGIVERIHCGEDGKNLKLGAKATAARELHEESGILLSEEQCEDFIDLPAAPGGWWGDGTHFNFGYVMHIDERPPVTGPEKDSQHELIRGGLERTVEMFSVHDTLFISQLRSRLVKAWPVTDIKSFFCFAIAIQNFYSFKELRVT
eukprot:s3252_g5.t1